jgi:pyruvate dehydrogenase E1 component alpha subunit
MPSIKVDGMDVYAVQTAMQEAVDRARRGDGPTLLEAKTYRFSGHSRADQALYRPAGELEQWQKRDPILLTEQALIKKGILDAGKIETIKAEMVNLVDSAITQALADPEPSAKDMFSNVFKELRK